MAELDARHEMSGCFSSMADIFDELIVVVYRDAGGSFVGSISALDENAAELSMATNMALPRYPRAAKWRTRSAAIWSRRSSRVIRW